MSASSPTLNFCPRLVPPWEYRAIAATRRSINAVETTRVLREAIATFMAGMDNNHARRRGADLGASKAQT